MKRVNLFHLGFIIVFITLLIGCSISQKEASKPNTGVSAKPEPIISDEQGLPLPELNSEGGSYNSKAKPLPISTLWNNESYKRITDYYIYSDEIKQKFVNHFLEEAAKFGESPDEVKLVLDATEKYCEGIIMLPTYMEKGKLDGRVVWFLVSGWEMKGMVNGKEKVSHIKIFGVTPSDGKVVYYETCM